MKPRREFFWILRSEFEGLRRKGSGRGIGLFALSTLALFWLFYALEPLLTFLNRGFVGFFYTPPSEEAWTRLPGAALEPLLPLLILLGLFAWLWARYRGKQLRTSAHLEAPTLHEGLVVLLSPYRISERRKQVVEAVKPPSDVQALHALLESEEEWARTDLRRQVFATTWGTLWAAVEHHQGKLRYCWLVGTEGEDGSQQQVETACRLVEAAALRPVRCYDGYAVENGVDVGAIVEVVDRLYRNAIPALDLEADNVIADFTGGTKGMTAGMILATLDRRRKIQYLRQDKPLLVIYSDKAQVRALTQEEIRAEKILATVETSRELVRAELEEAA